MHSKKEDDYNSEKYLPRFLVLGDWHNTIFIDIPVRLSNSELLSVYTLCNIFCSRFQLNFVLFIHGLVITKILLHQQFVLSNNSDQYTVKYFECSISYVLLLNIF